MKRFVRPYDAELPQRLLWFGLVLFVEVLLALFSKHYRFGVPNYERGAPFVFAVALIVFGGRRLRTAEAVSEPIRPAFLFANVPLFAGLLFVGRYLELKLPLGAAAMLTAGQVRGLSVLWAGLGVASLWTLLAVFFRFRTVGAICRRLGMVWVYAALCAAVSVKVRDYASTGWDARTTSLEEALERATFGATRAILHVLYPVVTSVPRAKLLGTPQFHVLIKGVCSGIEGMALIATLTIAWLFFTRRELRMERAVLLVPLSIAVMWCMNVLRLVVLIAIGNAGHRRAAIKGFHSVAGWMAFNVVSAVFLLVASRVGWFRVADDEAVREEAGAYRWRNEPAIYLTPFLAIVAASLMTQATTGGFEWLYALRPVAALVALWLFRAEYRRMDWKFGWVGVVGGLVVAGSWLAVRFWMGPRPELSEVTRRGLASLPVVARWGWIAFRVLAAVTTVPIAEELAFRGFVARRVTSSDVSAVPYARLSFAGIVVSSVLFGLMHGHMWAMGIASGVVFAQVAKMRGRLGEAVAAHMVANAVIAVAALVLHDYSLW